MMGFEPERVRLLASRSESLADAVQALGAELAGYPVLANAPMEAAEFARFAVQLRELSAYFSVASDEQHVAAAPVWALEAPTPALRVTWGALYLRTDSLARVDAFLRAFTALARETDVLVRPAGSPTFGSWFQRFRLRVSKRVANEEVQRRLEKLEHAVEVAVLHKPLSETNANHARAISELAAAAQGIDDFVGVAHGVVFVKTTDPSGRASAVARTLSVSEARRFQDEPGLMLDPASALERLRALDDRRGIASPRPPAAIDGSSPES